MPNRTVHSCQCSDCLLTTEHPNRVWHHNMNLLLSRLDEQQRRWYVALEADRIGHGGIRLLSQISGLDEKTIARGQQEMQEQLDQRPQERVRLSGGGRLAAEKKTAP